MDELRDIDSCLVSNWEYRSQPWIILRQYEDGMVYKDCESFKARFFAIDRARELARENPSDKFLVVQVTDVVTATVMVDVDCITLRAS